MFEHLAVLNGHLFYTGTKLLVFTQVIIDAGILGRCVVGCLSGRSCVIRVWRIIDRGRIRGGRAPSVRALRSNLIGWSPALVQPLSQRLYLLLKLRDDRFELSLHAHNRFLQLLIFERQLLKTLRRLLL